MTWQTLDRVKETTTTTGTGALTLAGAMSGFQSFASTCVVGDTFYYGLQAVDSNGNANGVWEVGVGTYSAASTLTRTSVLASSNSGSAVTLPTGTAQVWIDMPAVALAALQPSQYGTDQGGFVDGNFDFWDVNTTFSIPAATDTYTADMWIANAGTGGAATISRNARTLGSEPSTVTRPSVYQLVYDQTTAATTSPTIGQKLEGVGQYNGQTITVQASVIPSGITGPGNWVIGVRVTQHFGTGGSPSADVVTSQAVTWGILSTEKRFSAKINVPSISGKTLGTTVGTDYVRVDLLLATGGTYEIFLSQLQIDICNPNASNAGLGADGVPLPFRYRGLSLEIERAARYYQNGLSLWVSGTVSGSGIGVGGSILYPVAMRATPSVTKTDANVGGVSTTNTVSGVTNKTFILSTSSTAAGGYIVNSNSIAIDARF
jgi:hypothetical protein